MSDLDPQYFYEQWSGEPEASVLLRQGITVTVGGRMGQYEDEEYWPLVSTIRKFNYPAGTTRRQALVYEASMIRRNCPPFNVQHNPRFREQEPERLRLLGQPVPVLTLASSWVMRVQRWFGWSLGWALWSGVMFLAGAVAVSSGLVR